MHDISKASKGVVMGRFLHIAIDTMFAWLTISVFSTGGVAVAIAVPQLMGIILGRTLVGQIEYQLDIVASHRLRNRRQRN